MSREDLNNACVEYFEQNDRRGYSFGEYDCSTFVREALTYAQRQNPHLSGSNLSGLTGGTSHQQVQEIALATGHLLKGNEVTAENCPPGTIIACNAGDYSWDKGRVDRSVPKHLRIDENCDHVLMVVERDGVRGVIENSSSGGVSFTPMDEYLEKARRNGWDLYATDAGRLAGGQNIDPDLAETRTGTSFAGQQEDLPNLENLQEIVGMLTLAFAAVAGIFGSAGQKADVTIGPDADTPEQTADDASPEGPAEDDETRVVATTGANGPAPV